ncbi:MAG TPA: hypothetical protein VLS89_07760 [Candidatus Nanopelagicales bacterium]|nr:hypothetical protein [Candidatus Nanopelagicales bacterium]
MALRDPLGWADLRVEHLDELDPGEFEQFCCRQQKARDARRRGLRYPR